MYRRVFVEVFVGVRMFIIIRNFCFCFIVFLYLQLSKQDKLFYYIQWKVDKNVLLYYL